MCNNQDYNDKRRPPTTYISGFKSPSAFEEIFQIKEIARDIDKYQYQMEIHDGLKNCYGFLHGGAIATLFDIVMGYVSRAVLDKGDKHMIVTTDLNVRYLEVINNGILCIRVDVIRVSLKTMTANSFIYDSYNRYLAMASANFLTKTSVNK